MTYKDQVKRIVEGIKILSKRSYEIEGQQKFIRNQTPFSNYSGDLKNFGDNKVSDHSTERQNLINSLTNTIYSHYYCGISLDNRSHRSPSKKDRNIFMDHLSESNTSKGGYDVNWKIYSADAQGNAFVEKGQTLRWLQPKTFVYQNPRQQRPQVNTYVNIQNPKESRTIQEVFYHVFSDELFPQEVELARFYWNIKPDSTAKLIKLLTSTLNSYRIPFQFKCLNHPDLYMRTDAAVLYLNKKSVQIVSVLLKYIFAELKDDLFEDIPMFTKKLFKGVGYAEDPGKGMSFGMSRSSVIAEALVSSYESGSNNAFEDVLETLDKKGFVIERMHLNKHTELIPNFPEYD